MVQSEGHHGVDRVVFLGNLREIFVAAPQLDLREGKISDGERQMDLHVEPPVNLDRGSKCLQGLFKQVVLLVGDTQLVPGLDVLVEHLLADLVFRSV